MVKLIIATSDGSETVIDTSAGYSLMEAIRNGGVDELLAICGGCCSCATCHVYVDEAFLDRLEPAGGAESDLLDALDNRAGNSRLSCQVPVTEDLEGLRVIVAEED